MPSKTQKQARFMAACAADAGYESCPPQEVSEEFNQADTEVSDAMRGHVTDRRRVTAKGYRKTK